MNLPLRPSLGTPVKSLIDPLARPWLQSAALHLGLSAAEVRNFANSGLLQLPGLAIQLQPWRDTPEPQWLALGLLSRPNDVSPLLWNELLLGGNCAMSAISACAAAIDERGHGLLVNRLSAQPYSDTTQLGEALAVLIAVAESLIAGATALSARTSRSETQVEPPSTPVMMASGKAAMTHKWHRSLLVQALQHLGNTTPPENIDTVGMIRIGKQTLEIIADGDERHLLVSTAINSPLHSNSQRELALRANLELMTLTGCAVALTPKGACLQARWDCKGLDGMALGDWLGDFAQLAGAIGRPAQSSVTRSRL
jgi:hypothetical protein